ncbi:MAG: hypothetical protein IKQ39_04610 [Oscillospiraceae bacterium]|nr:hypothetical protein [Oscillospiraceae bacterium]
MNAKTLLRGFSEIDPRYLEAAMQAGADAEGEPETGAKAHAKSPPEAEAMPVVTVHRNVGKRLRIAGWAAAAACLLLVGGAMLHLRQSAKENVLIPPASQDDLYVEITGTAATALTTVSAQTVTTHTTAAGHIVSTAGTLPPEDEFTPSEPPQPAFTEGSTAAQTVLTQTAVQTALTDGETAPSAETRATEDAGVHPFRPGTAYAGQMPVLVAMADRSGTLPGGMQFEAVNDAQAVLQYLAGDDPAVTVGEGQKDSSTADFIMRSPEMLRVCWQTADHRWEEYGVQSAVLDADGVLHLSVCMYSGGGQTETAPWIYETALLFAGGSMPAIRDVQLDLQYFEEQNGISQWLAFNAALQDDVQIQYAQ